MSQPPSRSAAPGPSYAAVAGMIGLFLISVLHRRVEIWEADVFWHLATGRWILTTGQIPYQDPFSHTAGGLSWANHEWLFQVLLRGLQNLGGISALYAVKIVLYTAAVALPAWFLLRRGISPLGVLGALLFAVTAGLPFAEYRPLMGSLVLLGLTMEGARLASLGHRAPRIWLPLLFVFWGNFHATFPLGLLVLGVYLLRPERPTTPGQPTTPEPPTQTGRLTPLPPRAARLTLVALLAACAAATLLNPYGAGVWTVPARVAGSQLFMSLNEEWRPPDTSSEFWPFYLSLPLLAVVPLRRRWSAVDASWLLALVFAVASFKSRRIIPFYAVAALPALAGAVGELDAWAALRRSSHLRLLPAGVLLMLLVPAAIWSHNVTRPPAPIVATDDGLPFLAGAFPEQCIQTLRAAAPAGHLFNDYNHGGFLHYAVGPKWKVFIDGRNDLYGEKLTWLYNTVALGNEGWQKVFQQARVDAALVSYDICMHRPNIALALADEPGEWALVDFDDGGMLFLRRAAFPGKIPAGKEYRHVKPMLLYEEHGAFLTTPAAMARFVQELQRRAALGRSRIGELMLVQALADTGQTSQALDQLQKTEEFYGRDEMTVTLRRHLQSTGPAPRA